MGEEGGKTEGERGRREDDSLVIIMVHMYKDTKTVVTHIIIILCNESKCIYNVEITSKSRYTTSCPQTITA